MSKIFSIQAERKSSKTLYEKTIILKGDITAIYIEHEHRNTGASVLMLKKSQRECHRSIILDFLLNMKSIFQFSLF